MTELAAMCKAQPDVLVQQQQTVRFEKGFMKLHIFFDSYYANNYYLFQTPRKENGQYQCSVESSDLSGGN
ncbi:hypothetical protein T06_3573 [Trichinella sp. T6]|nr:hypothetical protein T06_3573 [Trichinella sp. T6]